MKTAPWIKSDRILGSLGAFVDDRLGLLERVASAGEVVGFRLGMRHFYLVAHPEGVKRVLVDNFPNYRKEPRGRQLLRALIGDGLVTAEDDAWRRQRRLSQPAFHKERIAAFAPLMARAASDTVARWRSGTVIDVGEEMSRLTLTIVGRALLSTDLADSASAVGPALTFLLQEITERTTSIVDLFLGTEAPTCRNRRFKKALAELDRVVEGTIARRRQDPGEHEDLLALLMAARDDEAGGMSDKLLRDQIMTMILAGHETTANALAWTFYLLSKNPAVERRARDEVAAVLGDREPSLEDLPRLRFVRATIEESMRLYPPVWSLGRSVVDDDEIQGYRIPAGTFIFCTPWITHRHPGVWPNPEGFDPERFLDEKACAERPRFAYFPFGGGARQCIGNTFALMEAEIILATVLQRFRLDLLPGARIVPEPLMTLRPKGGLLMTVMARQHAPLAVAV